MPPVAVKICGLKDPRHVAAAVETGAAYVGFVFFPKSPRHLEIDAARVLASKVPAGVAKVALTVNATDRDLDIITDDVPIDMLQLHGHETPMRVAEVKQRYGLPVMKAVAIADAGDVAVIDDFADVADQILIDAKPPTISDLPAETASVLIGG